MAHLNIADFYDIGIATSTMQINKLYIALKIQNYIEVYYV